jgi:hypothetical protein
MSFVEKAKKIWQRIIGQEAKDPRSIIFFQRRPHVFSEAELQTAGERGWRKRFDGVEDPMFFVSYQPPILVIVKAGRYVIRLTHIMGRYVDDDELALSQLPKDEQKKAWREHHGFVHLELFNDFSSSDKRIPIKEAFAALAQLALQLGDTNCTGVYIPGENIMMPNDGTLEEGLRMMVKHELPLG